MFDGCSEDGVCGDAALSIPHHLQQVRPHRLQAGPDQTCNPECDTPTDLQDVLPDDGVLPALSIDATEE